MAELPKPFSQAQIEVGWPKTFLTISAVAFIASLSFYFILAGYERFVSRQDRDLDKEIQDIAATLAPEEVQKLLLLDSQIQNLKSLLPSHTYGSRVLEYLEANTLPRTKYTSVSLSLRSRRLSLQGIAPDVENVSLQAEALSRAEETEAFATKNVGAGQGGFGFLFEVIFDKDLVLPR